VTAYLHGYAQGLEAGPTSRAGK